jgi:hypothetical protein
MGLAEPDRCAPICSSANSAATMMTLMSAKSRRSSRYVKMATSQAGVISSPEA